MASHGTAGISRRQHGAVMVLFVVAMIAMLGMVGLALDGAHGMVSKTRLQNLVDAAALSAAKTLDASGDNEALARAKALELLSANMQESGHGEIASLYTSGQLSMTIQFSATLDPFVPGSLPAQYVRVIATGLELPGWFIPIMGRAALNVAASAVAGPSPALGEVCNVVPMMACGNDDDPTDPFFGYTPGDVTVLKTSSSNGNFGVGPGNFQLVRLNGSSGAADVREGLAGSYNACVAPDKDTIPTQPGNTIGPVAQGLNTRFGQYTGPMGGKRAQYPSDKVLDQITPLTYRDGTLYYNGIPNPDSDDLPFDYKDYINDTLNPGAWSRYDVSGSEFRRVLRMPIGQCNGTTNGQGDVPLLGVLCFFLLQEVTQKGNEAEVYGQFMGADGSCPVSGKPGPSPTAEPGPYRIQLYKDPDATSA
jgi:hypothetical protein